MTWHDSTWRDNPVCQCTCDETVMSRHPGSHFLIISSVLYTDGNDSYEKLVHWGVWWQVFGCIKTAQIRQWIRRWRHFSSDLGSHVCAGQLFQCGNKYVYLEEYGGFSSEQLTNIPRTLTCAVVATFNERPPHNNIPNSDLCCGCHFHWTTTTQQYPEQWPVLRLPLSLNDHHTTISRTVTCTVVATFIERSPRKSVRKRSMELGVLHLTLFDHKRDLVMKTFWPVFVIELSDTDMRLCHKACALLLEWFLVDLSHGKVRFSDECAVYCSSLSWNVFWS